jgi:hypothetical protein
LPGLFVFDIPVTLLLTLIFHLWIRNLLIVYLPAPFNRKFAKYLPQQVVPYLRRKWYLVAFSGLVGAVSHIFWDLLGTPRGWLYHQAPDFFGGQLTIGLWTAKIYLIIEYGGSLIGLLFIAALFVREKGERPVQEISLWYKLLFWLSIVVITGLVMWLKVIIDPRSYSIGSLFVIGISGFFLGIIVTCTVFSLTKQGSKPSEGRQY